MTQERDLHFANFIAAPSANLSGCLLVLPLNKLSSTLVVPLILPSKGGLPADDMFSEPHLEGPRKPSFGHVFAALAPRNRTPNRLRSVPRLLLVRRQHESARLGVGVRVYPRGRDPAGRCRTTRHARARAGALGKEGELAALISSSGPRACRRSGEAIGLALRSSPSLREFTLGFGDTAIGLETHAAIGAALEENSKLEGASLQVQGLQFGRREGARWCAALGTCGGLQVKLVWGVAQASSIIAPQAAEGPTLPYMFPRRPPTAYTAYCGVVLPPASGLPSTARHQQMAEPQPTRLHL